MSPAMITLASDTQTVCAHADGRKVLAGPRCLHAHKEIMDVPAALCYGSTGESIVAYLCAPPSEWLTLSNLSSYQLRRSVRT